MGDLESHFISQFKSQFIGDDGAVVGDFIYSSDAFCEDTHFKREWMSIEQIAKKAMIVNISDAVAMNAKPLYALVNVMIPKDLTPKDTQRLAQALQNCAKEYGCEIIGGDTVGGDKLHFGITIVSKSTNPLTRGGLKEGDLLAYTGTLGESLRDLNILLAGGNVSSSSKFVKPLLRAEFVYEVREYIKAGMDISDGLYCDTNKILDYNHLGFEEIVNIPPDTGESGEEYEMLISFDPQNKNMVLDIANRFKLPLTIFAKVSKNSHRYPCKSHHFEDRI